MRSPLQAQLWELWRTGRVELMLRVSGMSVFSVLLFAASGRFNPGDPQILAIRGVVLMVMLVVAVFSAAWLNELDNQRTGFCFRLGFTRPISTLQLVLVPMLYTIIVAVACFVPPTYLFSLLLNEPFPILGPCTVVACIVSCFVASVWAPTSMGGKWIGLTATGGLLTALIAALDWRSGDPLPFLLAMGNLNYWEFAWYEFVGFFIVGAAAIALTVAAVERQRHGESLGRWPSWNAMRRKESASIKSRAPFRNRWTAQGWYELRRVGRPMLLLAVIAPMLVIPFVSFAPRWEHAFHFLIGALFVCPFIYQAMGASAAVGLQQRDGAIELSIFDATRAMPSDQLIAIKLLVVSACSIAGWFIMLAAATLQLRFIGDWQSLVQLVSGVSERVGDVPLYGWIAGVGSTLLFFVSTASILLALGYWLPLHPVFYFVGGVFFMLNGLLVAWDLKNDVSLQILWTAYGYILSMATLVISVHILNKSLSTGLLSKPYFVGGLCLWLTHVATTIALAIRVSPLITFPIPVAAYVSGTVMLLVPLAAIAAAPMALAAHRHR